MGFKKLEIKNVGHLKFKEDSTYSVFLVSQFKLELITTYNVITEKEKIDFIQLTRNLNVQEKFFKWLRQEGIEAMVIDSVLSFRDFRECIGCIEMFASNQFPLIFAKEGIDTSRKQDIGVFAKPFKRLLSITKLYMLAEIKEELADVSNKVFEKYDIYN
ncbi:hypothetical protein KDJ21_004065 [Metabacillus litoralis]|uniref:hypothetical protein n=1 Tax=Metabacillus litoralis TaxID=152268 RepID=UPI001B92B21A|nr:hypothetical protein [Metabacillus litoralis]UHA60887.1 hypothetical protein KDJ21_004065 [Metabacillus litoralis]